MLPLEQLAMNALRNLLRETEYSRTGHLASKQRLDELVAWRFAHGSEERVRKHGQRDCRGENQLSRQLTSFVSRSS